MRRKQTGFTLIELMIVVAIIGILAAIALPQYQNYMVKTRLVEATTDLDAAKIAATEAYQSGANAFPASANSPIAALGANAHFVTGLAYTSTAAGAAQIIATVNNTGSATIDTHMIGLFGVGNADGTVTWTCGTAATGAIVPAGTAAMYPFLPQACQH